MGDFRHRAPSPASRFTATSAVNITSGSGVLDLNGLSQTIGSLTGVPGSSVLLGGGALGTGGDNSSTTFAGNISGAGSLTKVGNGTFTVSGSNSYIGPTAIQGGILRPVPAPRSRPTVPYRLALAPGSTFRVSATAPPRWRSLAARFSAAAAR